jgi:hypothetical protein
VSKHKNGNTREYSHTSGHAGTIHTSHERLTCEAARSFAGMASRQTKLLRGINGIGGVSDRTLSKLLVWIKDHPEVAGVSSALESRVRIPVAQAVTTAFL